MMFEGLRPGVHTFNMIGWEKVFGEDKKGKNVPTEASYGGVLYYPHWGPKLPLASGITPPSAKNWDSIHAYNMEYFDNQKTVSSISAIGGVFKKFSEEYKKGLEGSQTETAQ